MYLQKQSHLSACLCAFFAGFRAFLTMFIIVFATFGRTIIAELCTNKTDLFCLAAAQTHQLRCCITNGGAFHIKLNAFSHHLYIFFLCAR
jgi:hypothetical protein